MNRRQFLIRAFKTGGFAALASIGLTPQQMDAFASWYYAAPAAGTPADVVVAAATNSASFNGFTASSGTKAECVAAEDASYIYRADTDSGQGFTDKPSLPAGTILGVKVHIIAKYVVGAASIVPGLRVNGSNYTTGGPQALTSAYAEYSYEWTTNPNTSAAWVKEDVEGTGAAPLNTWYAYTAGLAAGESIQIDKMWFAVRYNE